MPALSKKARKASQKGSKPNHTPKKNVPDLKNGDKKKLRKMTKSLMGKHEMAY